MRGCNGLWINETFSLLQKSTCASKFGEIESFIRGCERAEFGLVEANRNSDDDDATKWDQSVVVFWLLTKVWKIDIKYRLEHFSDIIGSMSLENAGCVLIHGLLCFIRGCARFFLFVGKRSCVLNAAFTLFSLLLPVSAYFWSAVTLWD